MSKVSNLKEKYFPSDSTIPVREQISYCGGIFGNCMGQDCVGTYGDQFYRNCMGISPEKIQIKDNITEILGFLVPPVAGALYDRDRGEGKMSYVRMALGSMPVPFAIASMLLFVVPFVNSSKNFIWAFIFGLVFSVSDTFFDMAMNTLALRLVPNPKIRKNFFTLTGLASSLGSALPGWVIPLFLNEKDDPKKIQSAYFYVALVFCIIGFVTMYTSFFGVKDRPAVSIGAKKEADGRVHWNKDIILAILRNRPFVILQISQLCDAIRQITYKFLPYLYKDTLDDYKMKTIFDFVSSSLSYAGLLAVPVVGNKVSAKNILSGGYAYTGFIYLLMSLFNIKFSLGKVRKGKYIIGILIGLAGMPNYAQSAARNIIIADSTDYMEWYSAKHFGTPMRSDGILTAAKSIFGKITSLVKLNAYDLLMNAIGYTSTNTAAGERPVQSDKTLKGIFMVTTICGLIGNFASALCFLFDNYTGKRKEQILDELREIRMNNPETLQAEISD